MAEIRAAAPAADDTLAVGGILLAAERLGFKARALKPTRHNLAGAPTPFLVAGQVPGEAWLATGRVQDHLLLLDPGSDRTTACSFEAVADLAERIVLVKPLAEPAQAGWRDTMLARLRPVLWELGIASVVINLLALATPLFLMTVYNSVTHVLGRPCASLKLLIGACFRDRTGRLFQRGPPRATELGGKLGGKTANSGPLVFLICSGVVIATATS